MKLNLRLARSAKALTDPTPSEPMAGITNSKPVLGKVPEVEAALASFTEFADEPPADAAEDPEALTPFPAEAEPDPDAEALPAAAEVDPAAAAALPELSDPAEAPPPVEAAAPPSLSSPFEPLPP